MKKPVVSIINVVRAPVVGDAAHARWTCNANVDGETGVVSFIGDAGWTEENAVHEAWNLLVADPGRLQGILSTGGGGGGVESGGGTLGGAEAGGAGHPGSTIKETQPAFTGDGVN